MGPPGSSVLPAAVTTGEPPPFPVVAPAGGNPLAVVTALAAALIRAYVLAAAAATAAWCGFSISTVVVVATVYLLSHTLRTCAQNSVHHLGSTESDIDQHIYPDQAPPPSRSVRMEPDLFASSCQRG